MKLSPLIIAGLISMGLAAIKLFAFLISGSLVVLSSFFDSLVDGLVSFTNARFQVVARRRADREHPYGHGGFEVLSSFVQGAVISGSGILVCYQSVERVFFPNPEVLTESLLTGAGILLFSAVSGSFLQYFLHRHEIKLLANRERSLALSADRAHYLGDFWFNLFGALGVVLVWYSGNARLDGIFGFLGGAFLLKAAFPILRQSYNDIVHREIDPAKQQEIVDAIVAVDARIRGVHRFRSRELGPTRFVDFHLKLPADLSLNHAHDIGEDVVRAIKKKFPGTDVSIHLDPDSEPDDEFWEPAFKKPRPRDDG